VGRDDQVDRRSTVIIGELAREVFDGFGVSEEEPAAKCGWVFVELRD